MIAGKSIQDLIDNLYIVLKDYNLNKEVMSDVETKLIDRNVFEAKQILTTAIALETLQIELLYLLSRFLYESTKEDKIVDLCRNKSIMECKDVLEDLFLQPMTEEMEQKRVDRGLGLEDIIMWSKDNPTASIEAIMWRMYRQINKF